MTSILYGVRVYQRNTERVIELNLTASEIKSLIADHFFGTIKCSIANKNLLLSEFNHTTEQIEGHYSYKVRLNTESLLKTLETNGVHLNAIYLNNVVI